MKKPIDYSDEDLLYRFVEGDNTAFDLMFKRYSPLLYRSAYRLFRNKEACEDMVQDLFIDLWERRTRLNIKSLRSYLYVSIRNRALTAIRSGKLMIDDGVLMELCSKYYTDQKVIAKELSQIIDSTIDRLPDKCKEVFKLSRDTKLSNKEIAERLNISIKTVESQMTIALRRLKSSSKEFLIILIITSFNF